MTWLRLIGLLGLALGAWRSLAALGTPIRSNGRRYYLQPDGRYRRWYGGRSYRPDEIGL
ncbi:hypothetical protein [Sphingomonas parva]|uniref:hypothetical protein n=1 Tax=Sphingomonas parva TaxID=2555898 RepID=UPI001430DA0C|nr:hypothetical protein [Sphingomonas parva]